MRSMSYSLLGEKLNLMVLAFSRDANHRKAVYNGVENNDIPMTILGVLDEKLIEKKDDSNICHLRDLQICLIKFKK